MPVNVNEIEPDEKIVEIEMERLREFRNHPFKVKADAQMLQLIESISKYGILTSGKGYRLATWELSDIMTRPMGFTFAESTDTQLMARFNFHGQYFTDADLLDQYLHFRCIPAEQYWAGVAGEIERMMKNPMIAAMMPTAEGMLQHSREIAKKRMGPVWMKENHEIDWINAFFGSEENMNHPLPLEMHHPSEEEMYLDHGYDETKPMEELTLEELNEAANFRGGRYDSTEAGDIHKSVRWTCGFGHHFTMSVSAVLQGGHWCPECLKKSWNYPATARKSPFFAQVWDSQHSREETYEIPILHSAFDIANELKANLGLD